MATVSSEFTRNESNPKPRRRLRFQPDFIRKARPGELLIRKSPYNGSILAAPVNYKNLHPPPDITVHDLDFHKHKDPMWHLRYRDTAPEIVHPIWHVKNQKWRARAAEKVIY